MWKFKFTINTIKYSSVKIFIFIFYFFNSFILASMVLAIKYNEDDYYSNKYYAKVGGIGLNELNELEYNLLILLEFNAFIDDDTYEKYENQLNDFEH